MENELSTQINDHKRAMRVLKEGIVNEILNANESGALRLGKEYLEEHRMVLNLQVNDINKKIAAIGDKLAKNYKGSL